MTEPQQADASSTAILVAVTELRGEVRAALAVQATHATTIDRHDSRLGKVENRLSVLETARAGDGEHEQRSVSNRAVFWTAVAAVVAIVGLVVTLFVMTHGGG
jgi:hypothetical protein